MGTDKRFDLRDHLTKFSDTRNTTLRRITDEVARRILQFLGGDIGDVTPPGPPTNLVAFAGVESVLLSWTAPPDLDVVRYRVQRSTTSGSGFVTVTETSDTSLVDGGLTGGTTYYYQVAAIDDAGNVGDYSDEASATPTTSPGSGTPPPPPNSAYAVSGDGEVTVFWGHPAGSTAVSVYVQRSLSPGTGYATIASGLTGFSYIDDTVSNGTTYYYILFAVNANGDVSSPSSILIGNPAAPVNATPGAPTIESDAKFKANNKSPDRLTVNWEIVPETDIAEYRVHIGTSTGVYTDTFAVPVVNNVHPSTYTIFDLDPLTTYYVSLTAVDTAGQESEYSAEVSDTTVATPPPITTPPDPPTGVTIIEEGESSITVGWNFNAETDIANYKLYGSLTSSSGPWILLRTLQPFLNTAVVASGLSVPGTTAWFYVTATNTSGLESDPSVIVSGTTGGGTTAPPPSGGTGSSGPISGDTGLGPLHKAPGATFDILFNAQELAGAEGAQFWLNLGAMIRNFNQQTPIGPGSRIAILLPEADNRLVQPVNAGADKYSYPAGVNFYASAKYYNKVNIELPEVADSQWHFVAPWPTNDLSDSLADAKDADKKFVMSVVDNTGHAYGGQRLGSGPPTYDFSSSGARIRTGFWFIHFNGAGLSTLGASGDTSIQASSLFTWGVGGPSLTLIGCDFRHDNPFWGRNATQYGGPSEVSAVSESLHPRWTVSCYRILIDQLHYCRFDSPWNYEHHIYDRNCPSGNQYWSYSDFLRCGGQIVQKTRRTPSPNASEGPIPLSGQVLCGTHYFDNIYARYCGRSGWSATYITWYGNHKICDIRNSTFINTSNGRPIESNWPVDDILSYDFPAGPDLVLPPAGFFTMSGDYDPPQMVYTMNGPAGYEGRINPGLIMRNVRVFCNAPNRTGIINWIIGKSADIEDCVFLAKNMLAGPGATTQGMRIGVYGRVPTYGPQSMESLRLQGNNLPGDITDFETDHPEIVAVSGTMDTSPDIIHWDEPPLFGTRSFSNATAVASFGDNVTLIDLI